MLASEAAPEELADGPTRDEGNGSEWSERDERMLKWLIGPRRESLPNTLFEVSELQDIDVRLQGLMKDLTETQKFTAEQIETMKATIDATREASTRIGRKDWVLLGVGALTALVVSAAFPPATVVHATKLFIHGVAHLFGEEVAG